MLLAAGLPGGEVDLRCLGIAGAIQDGGSSISLGLVQWHKEGPCTLDLSPHRSHALDLSGGHTMFVQDLGSLCTNFVQDNQRGPNVQLSATNDVVSFIIMADLEF